MSPRHYLHICNEECMCDLYESITDVVSGILSANVPAEMELSYLFSTLCSNSVYYIKRSKFMEISMIGVVK